MKPREDRPEDMVAVEDAGTREALEDERNSQGTGLITLDRGEDGDQVYTSINLMVTSNS